jgi:hypothetical protein
MKIYTYTSLDSNQHDSFYKFLIECSKETIQPASKNMYDIDWINKNNTLPYILNKTDRFTKNGSFNVLFENDQVIACSGCYTSDFSSEVVIAGSRTWIKNNYRHKHLAREYLLPYEKQWAMNTNHKCMLLTFNDYNKNLIEIWKRKRLGETREKRQPKHFGYNGIHTLDFPVIINYTKQYVLYEKLVPNFEFDWNTIKYI